MKNQQVSVDFGAMAKAMLTYGAVTVLFWMMLRMFSAVFSLPARMRLQQNRIQETLQEMQRRFPELNVTEEELQEAEKEFEKMSKEFNNSQNGQLATEEKNSVDEPKKTI